jgi:hypothetical protein
LDDVRVIYDLEPPGYALFLATRIRINGATLLQMSIEVIQYPLKIALEGNQYPLAKD